jgi:5-methylcytosine-specific restriction endonuclease McrA
MTKKVKKPRVARTRNAGTMTESAFWSMIRSALRQKSRWWKPVSKRKEESRRAYKGINKRQKWEYQCNKCKDWFKSDEVNIDHIEPAGSLNCSNDLPSFVDTLFCEVDNLQTLCKVCHDEKTQLERKLKQFKK